MNIFDNVWSLGFVVQFKAWFVSEPTLWLKYPQTELILSWIELVAIPNFI